MSEWLKQKIPDVTLRLTWAKNFGETWLKTEVLWPINEKNGCYISDDEKLNLSIAIVSGLLIFQPPVFLMTSKKKFSYPGSRMFEAGLNMYHHTPEFLHWLLDALTENEHADKLGEHIIIAQQKLAEIGALDEKRRFEL